jgi:hypothetical protein
VCVCVCVCVLVPAARHVLLHALWHCHHPCSCVLLLPHQQAMCAATEPRFTHTHTRARTHTSCSTRGFWLLSTLLMAWY